MSVNANPMLTHLSPVEFDEAGSGRASEGGLFSKLSVDTFYRGHAARLVNRLARRVGRDETGEVVQETFAKLSGLSAVLRGPIESPEAFVTTVATNVLRDRARAAARRALQDQQFAQEPHETAPDPHRIAQDREALRAVDRALAAMNPRRRKIFMLHRFEQMTYAEVGGEVGMSEKGVKKQIAKALIELRCAVERST